MDWNRKRCPTSVQLYSAISLNAKSESTNIQFTLGSDCKAVQEMSNGVKDLNDMSTYGCSKIDHTTVHLLCAANGLMDRIWLLVIADIVCIHSGIACAYNHTCEIGLGHPW